MPFMTDDEIKSRRTTRFCKDLLNDARDAVLCAQENPENTEFLKVALERIKWVNELLTKELES